VAAAAYRAGAKLEDHRTAMVFDFTRRSGVILAQIVAPLGAGDFAIDRLRLWNAAEAAEKRKDSRTAREWIIALPAELDAGERSDLARAFACELVERYGVVVDVAIHEPSKQGDERNHHAHLLCTTRLVHSVGFGEKATLELSDTKRKTLGLCSGAEEIEKVRARWADLVNQALATAGQSARIDHRSLADQHEAALERGQLKEAFALDRPAQRHVGVHATGMDRRTGVLRSERGLRRAAIVADAHKRSALVGGRAKAAIQEQADEALRLVAATHPVSTWARSGSHWTAFSPATSLDEQSRVDFGPAIADSQSNSDVRVEVGPERAEVAPEWVEVSPERAEAAPGRAEISPVVSNNTDKGEVPMNEWSIESLRAEIAHRERNIDQRLDEVPELADGRAALKKLFQEVRDLRIRQEAEDAKATACSTKASAWRRKHPLRAMFTWLTKPRALRALQNDEGGCLDASDKLMQQISLKSAQARIDWESLRPLDKKYRPALEREMALDAVQASLLKDVLSAKESVIVEQERRAILFAQGRVQTPGAPFCLQFAYDCETKAGPDSANNVDWESVGIRGVARALAAGNSLDDCQQALESFWPGASDSIPPVIERGRAQYVVDRVRASIEEGRAPTTEGGLILAGLVQECTDDDIAQATVLQHLDVAFHVLEDDRAFRNADESDVRSLAPERLLRGQN
jgi:hypothetical protein